MTAFFSTAGRVAALERAAQSWIGTPWCANAAARGTRGGVACHLLPRALYVECGALSEAFPWVRGNPNDTRHTRESVIEGFLDARPEFARLRAGDPLQPGDVIGIRIYHCVDHVGVVLPRGRFIHVLMHKHTCMDSLNVPPWKQRICAGWRPLEVPVA